MSLGIGLFVRDTGLKFNTQGLDMIKATVSGISSAVTSHRHSPINFNFQNPYEMNDGMGGTEDIRWLLG
jgi:hypothetical protein